VLKTEKACHKTAQQQALVNQYEYHPFFKVNFPRNAFRFTESPTKKSDYPSK
jgi:hypothetical protein